MLSRHVAFLQYLAILAAMAVADVQAWSKRLREVREGRGLSRSELALLSGTSSTTIWRMEGGKIDPRPYTRNRLIHALGYPDEDAFFNLPSTLVVTSAGTGKTEHLIETVRSNRVRELQGRAVGTSNVVGRLDDLHSSEARLLPIYRWGACGDPRDVDSAPDPIDRVHPPLGAERLVGPHGFGVLVKGDSMTNRSVMDGDKVWINPDAPRRVGRMMLARVWDLDGQDIGMCVKIWRNGEGFDRLWSDGTDDTNPIVCSRFEIIGPVVWIEPQGFPPDQPRRR